MSHVYKFFFYHSRFSSPVFEGINYQIWSQKYKFQFTIFCLVCALEEWTGEWTNRHKQQKRFISKHKEYSSGKQKQQRSSLWFFSNTFHFVMFQVKQGWRLNIGSNVSLKKSQRNLLQPKTISSQINSQFDFV